jgi:hypothetical protein
MVGQKQVNITANIMPNLLIFSTKTPILAASKHLKEE